MVRPKISFTMDKSNLIEEKESDNIGGPQKASDAAEGNTLPTFINNWVPLPSTATGTSALGMGNALNLNLPNFYQGSGGSVISGPPLLGGAMPPSGAPNNSTGTNGSAGSTNMRPEYLIMGNQNMSVNQQRALPGTTAMNNLSTDASGQRSHSNSFNGFSYSQHAYGTATGMPNATNNLSSTGGLATSHIDFMNINNSPPLLSSASATSSGMFLTSLPGKGNDNMTMLNHQNIYNNIHGILPSGSASYTNLSAFGNNSSAPDGMTNAQQTSNVGAKRSQPAPAPHNTVAGTAAGGANKKAKGAANRNRATSATSNVDTSAPVPLGGSIPPPQQLGEQAGNTGITVAGTRTNPSTSAISSSYATMIGGASGGTAAPVQLLPHTSNTVTNNNNNTSSSTTGSTNTNITPTSSTAVPHHPVKLTGPAPPSSSTITYPIMAAYKSSSVMSTGLVNNYLPTGANYSTSTAINTQGMQNYAYSTTGPSGAGNNTSTYVNAHTTVNNVGMQNTSINATKLLPGGTHMNSSISSDPNNRTYSYLPGNAVNTGNNAHLQQLHAPLAPGSAQNQQMNAPLGPSQHLQYNNSGQSNMNYGGAPSTQGMNYVQQQQLQSQPHLSQQQNTYLRPQPMLHNPPNNMSNPSLQQQQGSGQLPLPGGSMYNSSSNMMGGAIGPVGNGGGGAVQLQNYPLNTSQGHMNMNNNNNYSNPGTNMNNAMNNSMAMNYNPLNANSTTQQQQQAANNKAAPARARVRNKTPRPGKKAAGSGTITGPGDADGPPSSVTDANNQTAGVAVRPMTYKEKRAASSKKAIAAAAAAAAAEAERNGDPSALGLLMQADSRRRDTKRDRDNSLVEGEAGRSEREKAEKEESTTALLKRREPIVLRIEDIEDAKFLGRKGPGFVPPAILPVPPLLAPHTKPEESWGDSAEKLVIQARGLREEGQRPKTHWDYVLQEVQWMALDFRQELRWKVAASQRTAEACASSSSRCVLSSRSVRLRPADAVQARAAAKTLAQHISAFWQQLSDNVTSSSDQSVSLRSLMAGMAFSPDHLSDPELENVKPENINKLTDKILSLPTTIRSSDSGVSLEDASVVHPKTGKAKNAFFHSTPAVSSGNAPTTLLPHQLTALEHINALNAEKFGAVMHGKAYIGKTTAGCVLVKQWLQRSEKADDAAPVVVIVAERRCVFRWATELRAQQVPQVEVWSASSPLTGVEEAAASEGKVVVVSCDLLKSFLRSPQFATIFGKEKEDAESTAMSVDAEAASPKRRCVLQGILVDRRCVSDTPSVLSAATCTSEPAQGVLGQLASHLDKSLTRRCLIVEDAFLPGNVLESLTFLTPGTHYRDWAAKYPSAVLASAAAADEKEKEMENHQEQIVWNTLNQLLSNLSVVVKLPNNADSVIAAQVQMLIFQHFSIVVDFHLYISSLFYILSQTRVEVVTPEMDSVQARLYYAVASHLARHPSICSGESTTKLAAALLLLQKTCFHAALLTHKGRGAAPSRYIHPEARMDDAQKSELDTPEAYTKEALGRAGAPSFPANSLPMRSPPSYDLYWTNTSGEKGPPGHAPVSVDYSYQESTFSRGVLSPHDLSSAGNTDVLDQGSCKLQGLQRLLRRFAGLRVAVLIDTEDECVLVSQLLKNLNVQHEVAFAPSSAEESFVDHLHHNRAVEMASHWVASQKGVQVFNSPLNDTCVLLCSKHVFQPPNVPPQQADAVVILSDDWTQCTEVRDCFRLRLLSAGPTGPPLTVVRVAAGGTIEERMARKGCSLLQLQGTPLSQLWAGVKHSSALTSAPNSMNPNGLLGSPEPTLLSQAPMLVLPAAPKTLLSNAASPAPAGLLADGSRPGSDRSGSPMVVVGAVDTDNTNKRNNDSSLRGKGKGFIVLGKQGSTTFVKDHGPLQGLGFSRGGRTGVLPEGFSWSQRLRQDVATLLRQFDSRICSIIILPSGHLFVSTDVIPSVPQLRIEHMTSQEKTAASDREGDITSNDLNDDDTIKHILHRVFDQYVLGQAATLTTSDKQTGLTNSNSQCRLLSMLEAQLTIRFDELKEAHAVTRESLGAPPVQAPKKSFGPLELQRLVASGLGKSEAEDALSRLMLPYQYDSLLPLDCYKIKADVDASQHWPQSFLVFRDLLSEARRTGTAVDPVLFVNPLQTAHRGESIATDAFRCNILPSESAISIKYLAEGARNVSGTSRSSKSRRSRPSASSSRRKDSVTSTNTAENADISNVPIKAEGDVDNKNQTSAEVTFEVGFLSDLEPSGDTPQKVQGK